MFPPPNDLKNPLHWPVLQVYKDDQRSKVWKAQSPQGKQQVIKHFKFNSVKQTFLRLLAHHPADHEKRVHDRLHQLGIPVVRVMELGMFGSQRYLITPAHCVSLHNWIRFACTQNQLPLRHALADELGQIVGLLLSHDLYFRDMKLSNLVLDEADHLRLIDAGTTRKVRSSQLQRSALRMLKLLEQTARSAISQADPNLGVRLTRTDRQRVLRSLIQAWPPGTFLKRRQGLV